MNDKISYEVDFSKEITKLQRNFYKSIAKAKDSASIDKLYKQFVKDVNKLVKDIKKLAKNKKKKGTRKKRSDAGQPRGYNKYNKALEKARSYDQSFGEVQEKKYKDIGGLKWKDDKLERQPLTKELKQALKEATIDIEKEETEAKKRLETKYPKTVFKEENVQGPARPGEDPVEMRKKYLNNIIKEEVLNKISVEKDIDAFKEDYNISDGEDDQGNTDLDRKYLSLPEDDERRIKYKEAMDLLSTHGSYGDLRRAMDIIMGLERK